MQGLRLALVITKRTRRTCLEAPVTIMQPHLKESSFRGKAADLF